MSGPDDRDPPDQPRTVFIPGGGRPLWNTPSPPPPPFAHVPPAAAPMPPRQERNRIQPGDVLNNIFQVRRFIARGGMGEVFEGLNISSDERVAIKVMLPALAEDPNVHALFRKEARTLTTLSHPALVQYRVLAQEPRLNVLYIVTEYVDGPSLADTFGSLRPDRAQLTQLARRLADGLRAAHGLGAIHRDISPDNVLLEFGQLDRAKIIDFGIAKNLDPSSGTFVGGGFAGKLNYAAPEQLGAHGGNVGPWTDVYSLGLVLLATARGRDVDMGRSFAEAVDRRREAQDLSQVPEQMQSLLDQMLRPDPAQRIQSMTEVLAAIDTPRKWSELTSRFARIEAPPPPPAPPKAEAATPSRSMLIGGGITVALLVALGIWLASANSDGGKGEGRAAVAETSPVDRSVPAPAIASVDAARAAINAVLPSVGCTWLDITDIRQAGDGIAVALTGVADAPGRAQTEIARALAARGIVAKEIDSEEVATIPAGTCAALDGFRSIRNADGGGLAVTQRKWELGKDDAGGLSAKVVVDLNYGPPPNEVTLVGLQENGAVEPLTYMDEPVVNRATLEQLLLSDLVDGTKLGPNRYRVGMFINHRGWSGLLLLTGRGPFEREVVTTGQGLTSPGWEKRFAAAAAAGGWKAEMAWFRTVDEIPE